MNTAILVNTAVRNYNVDSCVVTYMYTESQSDVKTVIEPYVGERGDTVG